MTLICKYYSLVEFTLQGRANRLVYLHLKERQLASEAVIHLFEQIKSHGERSAESEDAV